MRGALAVLVIVYLVGVGVELAPTASHSSVSVLSASVMRELPDDWNGRRGSIVGSRINHKKRRPFLGAA
jgi:hypothetical protein